MFLMATLLSLDPVHGGIIHQIFRKRCGGAEEEEEEEDTMAGRG